MYSTALLPAIKIKKNVIETNFGFKIQSQDCIINIYRRVEPLVADWKEGKIEKLILFFENLKLNESFLGKVGIEKNKVKAANYLMSDILIYLKFGKVSFQLKKTLWYLLHNIKVNNPFFYSYG